MNQPNARYLNQMQRFCNRVKIGIEKLLPKNYGFAISICGFQGREVAYISNMEREDVIRLLREQADVLERYEG